MSNWNDRLRSKMKELELTQEELAKKLGVTRSAVAHYVQGTRQPLLKHVVKLAAILKVEPAWLQFGTTAKISQSKLAADKKNTSKIPIIEWEDVTNFDPGKSNQQKFLEFFIASEPGCFALQIKSDSMVSVQRQNTSLTKGTFIIVDPNKSPMDGQFVIATTTNSKKEPILRQYIEEGDAVYLKPLNPQYPLQEFDRKTKILGIVIANIQFT